MTRLPYLVSRLMDKEIHVYSLAARPSGVFSSQAISAGRRFKLSVEACPSGRNRLIWMP